MARGTLRIRIVGDASDLQRVLGSTGSNLQRWARRGVFALGAAVAGGVAGSIRAFANFDQAMTNSLAIMGDVSDSMRSDMASAAREVATTTQFSATEAAEAFFFLSSAGMDAAQSIEALPKVAAFAQAGQFDMAQATDLLTDAQSALGLASSDAAENLEQLVRVSDVLVGANTLANASVEEFSQALTQRAGAALRAMNKDVEEGVAVLAAFADQGLKGSEAGTALNSMLEGLSRTARDNADAYESLGVAVFDSSGEMRNIASIVGDLEVAFDGMSTEQRDAELASLGLTRQARDAVIALLGNAEAIEEYERQLRNAGGTTEDVADRQLQTFWAQLGLVKDQLIDVGLSIGEALMPALMRFVDWIQEKLPAITSTAAEWAERFTSFFTDTSEAVDENTAVMDGWAHNALASRQAVADEWAQLPHDLRHSLPAPDDFAEFHDIMEEQGTEGGSSFMTQLRAALADLWESEVVPLWNDTVIPWWEGTAVPWIENELGPMLGRAARAAGSHMAEQMWEGFQEMAPRFLRWLSGDYGVSLTTALDDFQDIFYSGGESGGDEFTGGASDGITAGTPGVLANARQMMSDAADAARGRRAEAETAGRHVGDGLGAGMSAARPGLLQRARSLVRDALAAARSEAGISSPSRVWAQQVGVPLADGVIAGLQSRANAVARAQLRLVQPPSTSTVRLSPPAGGDLTMRSGRPIMIPVHVDGREVARAWAMVDELSGEVRRYSRNTGGRVAL